MEYINQIIKSEELQENIFTLIGREWMLITAGTPEHYNTMTASWGGLGVLWGRNVCFVFIRPGRLTHEFMENAKTFSLCFFDKEWQNALNICGTKSGREIDKAAVTGLIPDAGSFGTTIFQQARLVMSCKKLYYQDLNPEHFLDNDINKNYPIKDYHRMYIGEILETAIRRVDS